MEQGREQEQYGLLEDGSPAFATPLPTSTPSPPARGLTRHRPGYARMPSVSFVDEDTTGSYAGQRASFDAGGISPPPPQQTHQDQEDSQRRYDLTDNGHGLGIAMAPVPTSKFRRQSVQAASPLRSSTTPADASIDAIASSDVKQPTVTTTPTYVLSPRSTGMLSGSTQHSDGFADYDLSYDAAKKQHLLHAEQSRASLRSERAASLYATQSEAGLLNVQSRYEDFHNEHTDCQSGRQVRRRAGQSRVYWVICLFALVSTVLSAIFLVVALRGPFWDRAVSNDPGRTSPAAAATITSLLAKLIEMTFTTVVVAYVGQHLWRRATKKDQDRGVTLAEINMRHWIMSPGTMVTQWQSVRFAGITLIGMVALLASVFVILYTSAATALVQPQLKLSAWKFNVLQGLVKTQFANVDYIKTQCHTPITTSFDSEYSATTCVQMEHVAAAYHNYYGYLSTWTALARSGDGSKLLATRPKGFALLNDNTTITAPWIEPVNVTTFGNASFPRYVNNVTMAMPHVGVIQAAIDPINDLMQPDEVDGSMYSIRAAVPSPFVNVLCATVLQEDLTPFIYDLWPGVPLPVNYTAWTGNFSYPPASWPWLGTDNGTANANLSELFRWGPRYGAAAYPPVFPRLPIDYNTLVNDTLGVAWGRTAIYLLGKAGPQGFGGNPTSQYYSLCQLQVGLTPGCSTRYNASATGGFLEAVCDEKEDEFAYVRSVPDAPRGNETLSKDWVNIGGDWARSLSLNTGLYDGNGATMRQLTQFMVTTPEYNTAIPSMAEALAVLAGCTLIEAVKDSPFEETWRYTLPTVDPGDHQPFNASVRVLQYASGGVWGHQKSFMLVLLGVVLINFYILGYLLLHRHWYTDFSDPVNLFGLAINSPPSRHLAGHSCGHGPKDGQYLLHWKLNQDDGHYYVESREPPPPPSPTTARTTTGDPELPLTSSASFSPRASTDAVKSPRRRWTQSMGQSFEMMVNPVKKRFSSMN